MSGMKAEGFDTETRRHGGESQDGVGLDTERAEACLTPTPNPPAPRVPERPRPDLSIIIVTWNTRELLAACLAALPAAVGELSAETWVVDNASSDGTVAMVRERF